MLKIIPISNIYMEQNANEYTHTHNDHHTPIYIQDHTYRKVTLYR